MVIETYTQKTRFIWGYPEGQHLKMVNTLRVIHLKCLDKISSYVWGLLFTKAYYPSDNKAAKHLCMTIDLESLKIEKYS